MPLQDQRLANELDTDELGKKIPSSNGGRGVLWVNLFHCPFSQLNLIGFMGKVLGSVLSLPSPPPSYLYNTFGVTI